LLITARSGHGKTTLIMRITKELLRVKIPFLIFDFKKDYRHLIRHFSELYVLSWKDLKINLLEPPPKVEFNTWKQVLLWIIGSLSGVWHGSLNYLLQAIDETYKEKGRIPRLSEVYNKIVNANENSRKMLDYASAIEVRLYGLLSQLGQAIDSERTLIDIEKLLEKPVVLELHDLSRDNQNVIILWFFFWIYAYRKEHNIRERLTHLLIIDEAKRVFPATEAYSQTTAEYSKVPPSELILDEIRSYTEGLILADQEPTKLSNAVKANTYIKICGFLGNGKDIDDMAQAMNLNEEEREVISHLEQGEWLVKLAGRYTKPFMIKTEDFPLERDVSDEELKELMKTKLLELYRHERKDVVKAKEINDFWLSRDEWILLLDINNHPFYGLVERMKSLGFSAKRLERAKKGLLSKGLANEVEISLTGRRPRLFLILTEKSLRLLKSKEISTRLWDHIGNVGFEHTLFQVLISWYLRKIGYETKIEANVGKRRVDILATDGKYKIGFEIELNPNASLEEKLKDLKMLDALLVVTRKEDFHAIKEKITNIAKNVRIYSIDRLLERLIDSCREDWGINSFGGNKSKPSFIAGNKIDSHRFQLKGSGNFEKNNR